MLVGWGFGCPRMQEPAHVIVAVTLDRLVPSFGAMDAIGRPGKSKLLLLCRSFGFEAATWGELRGFYVLAGAFPWGLIALLRSLVQFVNPSPCPRREVAGGQASSRAVCAAPSCASCLKTTETSRKSRCRAGQLWPPLTAVTKVFLSGLYTRNFPFVRCSLGVGLLTLVGWSEAKNKRSATLILLAHETRLGWNHPLCYVLLWLHADVRGRAGCLSVNQELKKNVRASYIHLVEKLGEPITPRPS